MAELEKYQKNILREIKRDFSKDEVVVLLFNQIKEKDIEIGKLKSFIQELEDKLNEKNMSEVWFRKYKKQDELYRRQLDLTTQAYRKNRELKVIIKELNIKYEEIRHITKRKEKP